MVGNDSVYYMGLKGTEIGTVATIPVLTVHANYVANDYVGTSATPMTFSNCARIEGGGGYITSVMIIDKALQSVAGELWLFDSDPTPPNDSAAWTITDGDALRLIGVVPVSTYYASAANSVGQSDSQPLAFKCASGSKDLYGCFVTRGAPSYASGDLMFVLRVIRA